MSIIEKIIERYNTAKNKNIKDIRLSIEEAEQLVVALMSSLENKSQKDEKIIKLQQEIIELQRSKTTPAPSNITYVGDGGTF
jgi:lipase chaperone LimK